MECAKSRLVAVKEKLATLRHTMIEATLNCEDHRYCRIYKDYPGVGGLEEIIDELNEIISCM